MRRPPGTGSKFSHPSGSEVGVAPPLSALMTRPCEGRIEMSCQNVLHLLFILLLSEGGQDKESPKLIKHFGWVKNILSVVVLLTAVNSKKMWHVVFCLLAGSHSLPVPADPSLHACSILAALWKQLNLLGSSWEGTTQNFIGLFHSSAQVTVFYGALGRNSR